jgi:hypothetical protein
VSCDGTAPVGDPVEVSPAFLPFSRLPSQRGNREVHLRPLPGASQRELALRGRLSKWQVAILKAEQNRWKLRLPSND